MQLRTWGLTALLFSSGVNAAGCNELCSTLRDVIAARDARFAPITGPDNGNPNFLPTTKKLPDARVCAINKGPLPQYVCFYLFDSSDLQTARTVYRATLASLQSAVPGGYTETRPERTFPSEAMYFGPADDPQRIAVELRELKSAPGSGIHLNVLVAIQASATEQSTSGAQRRDLSTSGLWIDLGPVPGDLKYFLDPKSVTREGAFLHGRVIVDFPENGPQRRSDKILSENLDALFDCGLERMALRGRETNFGHMSSSVGPGAEKLSSLEWKSVHSDPALRKASEIVCAAAKSSVDPGSSLSIDSSHRRVVVESNKDEVIAVDADAVVAKGHIRTAPVIRNFYSGRYDGSAFRSMCEEYVLDCEKFAVQVPPNMHLYSLNDCAGGNVVTVPNELTGEWTSALEGHWRGFARMACPAGSFEAARARTDRIAKEPSRPSTAATPAVAFPLGACDALCDALRQIIRAHGPNSNATLALPGSSGCTAGRTGYSCDFRSTNSSEASATQTYRALVSDVRMSAPQGWAEWNERWGKQSVSFGPSRGRAAMTVTLYDVTYDLGDMESKEYSAPRSRFEVKLDLKKGY